MEEPSAPSVWVQWKGTELCADFRCTCGARGHIDNGFCYRVRCEACGQVWELPQTLTLTAVEGDWDAVAVEDDRERTRG